MEGDYVFSLFGIYAPIYLAKDKIHSCDLWFFFFFIYIQKVTPVSYISLQSLYLCYCYSLAQ